MNEQEKSMIETYLEKVRKKLPEWLKWKEEEANNILEDLKLQILNEARLIAGGSDPTEMDIQQALIQTGTPESIARIYKKRGTPKLYITEELFEFYLRTLVFFWLIVITISVIVAIFQFIFKPWWEALGSMFSGMWIGVLITAVVITVVFVYFSMEGFLPEDFGVFPQRLATLFPFSLEKTKLQETKELTRQKLEEAMQRAKDKIEKARIQTTEKLAEARALRENRLAEAELRREQKLVEARKRREQKLAEAKLRREEKLRTAKQKRELKKRQPVTLGELIFGAIAGTFFGIFLILQPFVGLTTLFDPNFLEWLMILGILIFLSGLINLVRLILGVRNHTGQQVLLVLETIYSAAYIPVFLFLLNHPEIFPINFFSGGNITMIPFDRNSPIYIAYFWVHIGIFIAIIGSMIGNLVKVYKIQRVKSQIRIF
ncbi:MAG: cell envelope integrity protein TolA [Candidatus Thorarchaeota archaeon]